ncbi:MAG: hypothetical protein EGR84_09470 [Coprococcus catus]|nr:hypothetical protein [Coprococcus catus]
MIQLLNFFDKKNVQTGVFSKISKEKAFFCALILYLVTAFLSTSFYASYVFGGARIARLVCVFLLVVGELSDFEFSKETLVKAAFCLLLYGIAAYHDGALSDPALVFAFVFCGRNISFDKIAKVCLFTSSFLLGFIIISSYVGIIRNYVENYDGRYREYLGFLYSLYPAAHMSNITSLTIYLKRKSIDWKAVSILLLANIWIFAKTNSRLSFGLSILTICLALVFQYVPELLKNNKMLQIGMKFSFVIFACVSLVCTLLYTENNIILQRFNTFLGNRLYFGKRSLFQFGVSFFGKSNIEWVGNGLDKNGIAPFGESLYVDNLYIQVIQKFGIIFVVLLLILLTIAMIKIVEQKKYILAFIFTMIAIHCIIDDLFLAIFYNPFWIAAGAILMSEENSFNIFHRIDKGLHNQ